MFHAEIASMRLRAFALTGGRALALVLLLGPAAPAHATPSRNIDVLARRDDYPAPGGALNYAACWGYVHSDGREYAALAVSTGTAIYRLTDPSSPVLVAFIPGPESDVREMKSYRDWIYVSTEGTGAGQGIQVIRMADPDHPVLAATFASDFIRTHTLQVDTTRALLYCNGTHNASGSESAMRILSLANPEAPVQVGRWPASPFPVHEQYVHDGVVAGTRYYASSLYGGQRAFDVSNPAAPAQIASWLYPGLFSHSCWPDSTGRYLYVCDEMTGEPVKVFDLASLAAPVRVNGFTSNAGAIVHNPRVRGHELYLSNYSEGFRVLDASDPVHPAEFGWADTFLGDAGGYNGCWEVYPFFPSGIAIASDRQNGLWVFRPVRDYGIVDVTVRDAATGLPLPGASVRAPVLGDSLVTPADGRARFAPNPGWWTVRARKFGWSDASAPVSVTQGGLAAVTLDLAPLPRADFTGTALDRTSGDPLDDAQVVLRYSPLEAHADSLGAFTLAGVPAGEWALEVRAAGHAPLAVTRHFGGLPETQAFSLRAAPRWDALETASGWTVGAPGDNATSGLWVRVEPNGTGEPEPGGVPMLRTGAGLRTGPEPRARARAALRGGLGFDHEGEATYPGEVQPEYDHTPGAGEMCFVTGQGTLGIAIREQDVDGGRTTLTSPAFDVSGMTEPTIAWWEWFFTDIDDGDRLIVQLSGDGGATWIAADTTRGFAKNHWHEHALRVADFVTPSAAARIRFIAADDGNESVVEAAVDDVIAYDAALPAVAVAPSPPSGAPRLRAWPTPSREPVTILLALAVPSRVTIEVHDVAGRVVRTLFGGEAGAGERIWHWDGHDAAGRPAPAGFYIVRARAGGVSLASRVLRLP